MYYNPFYYLLNQLLEQNKEAILALPSSVKSIITITLALWFGTAIIRKARRLMKYAVIATVIYFVATSLGLM